jgi:hypothetical protein
MTTLAEAPARDAYEIGDGLPITAEWRRDSRTLSAGPAILQRRAAVERYACQYCEASS